MRTSEVMVQAEEPAVMGLAGEAQETGGWGVQERELRGCWAMVEGRAVVERGMEAGLVAV